MSGRDVRTLLCVDPDQQTADHFEKPGFELIATESIKAARDSLDERAIDCVVAEYQLTDGKAFDLFEVARDQQPTVGCVLFTEKSHGEIDLQVLGETVTEYVSKESQNAPERLIETVERIVDERSHVGFPLPSTEDERLDAVTAYDLPGLEAVEAFDRLTSLVADHFGVRVAFVGLVKEGTEQFISCHGAEWSQLPREDSICTYAILEEEVTVIEDVRADPRFAHNEVLDELDIRSYAGANLTAADGTVIGELCLIDSEPRTYTTAERERLRLFAAEVSEQLELRQRLGVATLPDSTEGDR